MSTGIIYLIQPAELFGTNRYKIGCSENASLNRITAYKKGTRYIVIMECYKPYVLEKEIKKIFNEKFKLIAGYEYFEGVEEEIKTEFLNIVNEYEKNNKRDNNIEQVNNSNSNNGEQFNEEQIENIRALFKNYKEDYNFGGKKYLIKCFIHDTEFCGDIEIEIHSIHKHNYKGISVETLYIYDIHNEMNTYIKNLIDNKIIEDNTIYDLNDVSFLKKLKKFKIKLNNVVFSEEIKKQIDESIEEALLKNQCKNIEQYINLRKIHALIKCDCIINEWLYCYYLGGRSYAVGALISRSNSGVLISRSNKIEVIIIKFPKVCYEYKYLRKYLPYCIEYTDDSYYIINRDGTYIGLDVQDNPSKEKNWKKCYLPDYGSTAWGSQPIHCHKNLKKITKMYNDITSNKLCMNPNDRTQEIIMQ